MSLENIKHVIFCLFEIRIHLLTHNNKFKTIANLETKCISYQISEKYMKVNRTFLIERMA